MPTIEREIWADVDAPAIVRRELETLLGRRANPDAVARVKLLASELVTATLRDGSVEPGETLGLQADLMQDAVRVEVDRVPPSLDDDGLETDPALLLVRTLADGWGVDERGDAGRAWFEVELRPRATRTNRFRREGAAPARG